MNIVGRREQKLVPWTGKEDPLRLIRYSRSSLNGHSRKRTALLTAALFETPFYASHTNSVFLH